MCKPFAYRIKWSKLNKSYYGIRYAENCDPSDLWVRYYTSSKEVAKFREIYGEPDIVEIRRSFTSMLEALSWETRVLTRLNVKDNPNWINQQTNCPMLDKNPMKGRIHSAQTRAKISEATQGRIPWNKGKRGLQPANTERMKNNNPMSDPETAAKVASKLRGKPSRFKIVDTCVWKCEECGHSETRINTKKRMNYRFCDKSCAASFSNKARAERSNVAAGGSRTS